MKSEIKLDKSYKQHILREDTPIPFSEKQNLYLQGYERFIKSKNAKYIKDLR